MRQYIMGMLTGASLILCAFMFMGNAPYQDAGDIYDLLYNVESKVSKIEDTVEDIESDVEYISLNISCN